MGKSDYEYLDEERRKLWHKVNSVETELHQRISDEIAKIPEDYVNESRQASKKASEYRNKSEEAKNLTFQYLSESENNLLEIKTIAETTETLNTAIRNDADEASINKTNIKIIYDDVELSKSSIEDNVQKLEELFEDYDSFLDKISKLQDILTKGNDTSSKIETLYKSLLVRKNEIDQIYYDIFGYSETENGVETQVEGLKDKLEKSYDDLGQNIKTSEDAIAKVRSDAIDNYDIFQQLKQSAFDSNTIKWNSTYDNLITKIEALLPNALTAGLSSAYSQKKDAEIKEYSVLNKAFIGAIWGLVLISLIPFIISIVSIVEKKSFDQVLLDMPRLVLSILPLYIPILWVAYSSNRKMNLSKRLSEEYSHKEVLSKTFEGLSTQINNISDVKISNDLRNKLLYNILEVSSENPGKLISDYNKSDHPLMDALDKSVQLAIAFEKLEKIPGLSKLADKLNKKSKSILAEEDEMANKGLDSLSENA
jgi:tetrahydromethanopterin S-methyltransferase subunit B